MLGESLYNLSLAGEQLLSDSGRLVLIIVATCNLFSQIHSHTQL